MKNKPAIRYKKSLVCEECGETFRYRQNLLEHIKKEHKKISKEVGWIIDFKK
jgi:uncharacterized C2H2 Zn-finger protein